MDENKIIIRSDGDPFQVCQSTGKTRRDFLIGASAVLGSALLTSNRPVTAAEKIKTKARIVIAGGGAAGLAAASQLVTMIEGADIKLFDARREHYYQPGFTLVAGGLKPPSYTVSNTSDYIPAGVQWIEESIKEFDPEGNSVTTEKGQRFSYDFLIVATGLKLDFSAIAGMDLQRVGKNGLGCPYAGPDAAYATWQAISTFADKGGVGLFGRPKTEMKCAGAPIKHTFITDDHLRRRGNRTKAEIIYTAHNKALFSVPIVSEKVRMLYEDRGISVRHDYVLIAIDPDRRRATYTTPTGTEEIGYDYINVIPPMRAPDPVRTSLLAWREGAFAADGWMEVEPRTLRHRRFTNVFGVGDVAGVPKGKTAASVKWQIPVALDHLLASIKGGTASSVYSGYTSCPLITRLGRAMLIEFDYKDNLVPSFPGVIAPLEELWITWVMKTIALKPTYIAMLRGKA